MLTVQILVPALVCVIGLLGYLLMTRGEPKEIGRIMFAVGLFFVVAALASHVVRF